MSTNSIWNQIETQNALRAAHDPVSLDGRTVLVGITKDATPTELFVRPAQTAGLDVNSVPYYSTNGRVMVEPSTLVTGRGSIMALRTDTLAVYHNSEFAWTVYRPATGNAIASGSHGTVDFTATSPAFTKANPATQLIQGTAANAVWAINTDGSVRLTVTGTAGQTIIWRAVLNTVRALSAAIGAYN